MGIFSLLSMLKNHGPPSQAHHGFADGTNSSGTSGRDPTEDAGSPQVDDATNAQCAIVGWRPVGSSRLID